VGLLAAECKERGHRTTRLRVDRAFHSPLMEPMLEGLREVLEGIDLHPPRIAVVSNLTGAVAGRELATPQYWIRHVREAVRFADGIATLAQAGVTRFLEVGPDGVLAMLAEHCLDGAEEQHRLVKPALRRRRSEPEALMDFLASADIAGVSLDWRAVFAGRGAQHVDLPTYAFQRERFWLTAKPGAGDLGSVGQVADEHPLLGAAVELPEGAGWLLTGRLSPRAQPWLCDHVLAGRVVLPGAAFVELALHAAERAELDTVEELILQAPLVLGESGAAVLQVHLGGSDERGARTVTISSRAERDGGDWTRHATGTLIASPAALDASPGSGAAGHRAPLRASGGDGAGLRSRLPWAEGRLAARR
jgi:acyl transferase domain-containing protein